jgi:hypothetical protein
MIEALAVCMKLDTILAVFGPEVFFSAEATLPPPLIDPTVAVSEEPL